ncbi:MAG: KH domain-containing protein [Clostridia bacterium]|nr:KH domain-containing protein [Clostridia bacterium]
MSRVGDLVAFLARSIVDYPDAVGVRETEEGETLLVELLVAQADLGKVIGRQGRTIQAIRQLARVAGHRQKRRVRVEVPDRRA